jgi:adenylate cyclase class 2
MVFPPFVLYIIGKSSVITLSRTYYFVKPKNSVKKDKDRPKVQFLSLSEIPDTRPVSGIFFRAGEWAIMYSVAWSIHKEGVMHETEIKILGIDRKKLEKKLLSLGAEKTFDGEIHAFYYDTPDRSVRARRGTFRLRREGTLSVLTFKAHVDDSEAKVREETEVTVSDFNAMRSILKSVGFFPWMEMKKHRTTYSLPGVHFELDKYTDEFGFIPEFLEIEARDIGAIYKNAAALGFSKEDCRPWDALQVAEYYSTGKRKS